MSTSNKSQNDSTTAKTSAVKQESTYAWWRKVGTASGSDWTADEVESAIHWVRQFLGLIVGLIWGISGFTGALYFIGGIGINFAVTWAFYSQVLDVQEEDVGQDPGLFLQAGGPSSMALFLLAWILTYTELHF
eukprot:c3567_g1_i1.p1 GENE.c3567_g1_i1~~c3567_g1_i1.p1  ORF type:complete len:147 (+),score=33.70 c3567_g1_i1:45-443(+)